MMTEKTEETNLREMDKKHKQINGHKFGKWQKQWNIVSE